jgi:rod shape-determining protein MreD
MTRIILRALNSPILIFLVIIGVALQSSLFSGWPFHYFQPDIVLLVVVWCALRRGFTEGGILTLLLAEICEIHSTAPQGLYLSSYMIVYLGVRVSSQFLVAPTLSAYAVFALLSSIVLKLVSLLILYLLGVSANEWKHTVSFLLTGAAVEAAFSLWVFRWLEKFDWVTFKNAKAEHALDDELQLDSEGF